MQDFIDLITSNLAFFVGLLVFVIFTVGFVLALRTEGGRDALATAAVRFAIAALAFAEKWLGDKINPPRLAAIDGQVQPLHPVVQAQVELQSWLAR